MKRKIAMIELRVSPSSTGSWTKQGYEAIYSGHDEIRQLDSFYTWLLNLIEAVPGRRLLDVACGVGVLPNKAAEIGLEAYGVDMSEEAMRTALGEGSAGFVIGNGESLPYPAGYFDYVTSIGSLEHYLDPFCGARELARVMVPHGRACILLPNLFSILGTVYNALKHGRTVGDNQPLQRYAALKDWQDLLEQGGFIVERVVKYERERPRSLRDLSWYLRHPKPLVRLLLTPFIPLNWASCFVYLCRKR
ncbi:MAG: methyltransferase domain-containing protein [Candidatus Aminicenantes bacterium]|nr:methyltransferase domain-containing protein [Candidatus Aminicenantes bacterium]